jgi:Asp-tRNA(Asn)/Glu-tRNA(Gln) amidotransferase A subunit family amidase
MQTDTLFIRTVLLFVGSVLTWICHASHFEPPEASIASLHAAIMHRDVTCHDVVDFYRKRILALDQSSGLNAIVVLAPDALRKADELDAQWRRTHQLRPLHCVTLIVKDNYETKGLQTTAGSLAMKGYLPREDAEMVVRLQEAGAIVLAKSNMAEWAFSPYKTESSIAGITRNPYDLRRVPAGSSGGTAAAIAAGFGAVGLGSDTGNSIRGPSSHTALVGLRPTIGLTSRRGIIPLFAHNDVGGPMTRSVSDTAALLTILAAEDAGDPVTARSRGHRPSDYQQFLDPKGLSGVRIGVFRRYLDTATTDPEIRALTERAIAQLRSQGAQVVDPFDLPDYETRTAGLWCGDFQHDLDHYLDTRAVNAPMHSLAEIVESGLYLPYIAADLHAAANPPTDPEDRRSPCGDVYSDPPKIALRAALTEAMAAEQLDAIVYPTWSNPPRIVGDMDSPAGDNSQILSPQTGWPAITVPMGYTHATLPAGLTFLGPAFSEGTLIRMAYAFEQATHHRHPPPDLATHSAKN